MSGLSAFMAENALPAESVKYIASKRFLDDDGKPMEWELRAISSAEAEELRKKCRRRVPVPGKRGQFTEEIDGDMYFGKLAAACTVFPDLNNSALQDSYHVLGADALLKAMLTAGEYDAYAVKIQEIGGWDTDMQELVDEAKN